MKLIYGKKPVLEALLSGEEISKICILPESKGRSWKHITDLAGNKEIIIEEVTHNKLLSYSNNANHQGIVAFIKEFELSSLSDILEAAKKSPPALLLILDSIQDPHNLGALLRTADAAGVNGVIITKHNSSPITSTVEKTAAGAVRHLKICRASNLVNTIKILKKENIWIFGTTPDAERSIYDLDLTLPAALIVGNEEKGIKRLLLENCDFTGKIPMFGKIDSLNVSVSGGILLFESIRQRKTTQ